MEENIVIGITGQFGSGCSTLRDVLSESPYNFNPYSFSSLIKKKAKKLGKKTPKRYELQDIGNYFRSEQRLDYWATEIIEQIDGNKTKTLFVVDGFRNVAEIDKFRKHFPSFYLVAMNVEQKHVRWERVKNRYSKYGENYKVFEWEDDRDKNEGLNYGQQVSKCVYLADIIIDNPNVSPERIETIKTHLRQKVERYVNIISPNKNTHIPPDPDEEFMQIAYSTAISSPCMNRQVGAVIIKNGNVISRGFNTTPDQRRCEEQFGGCHKELRRKELWKEMWSWVTGKKCPKCSKSISKLEEHLYRCSYCHFDLERFFIPTKGAEHCIALHAEDQAITKANYEELRSSEIYITTFPCFQCALKIIDAEISKVVYVEPYPLPESELIGNLFKKAKISVQKFEGIKGQVYLKLFSDWASK